MIKVNFCTSNQQDIIPVSEDILDKSGVEIVKYVLQSQKIFEESVLNGYDLTDITLSIDFVLCDDKYIHELNSSYRGFDKPTDVLSFAMFADAGEHRIIMDNQILLGEIIISVETAKKQAEENDKTFESEIYFLLSHGILHLLGFDHQDEDSLSFMIDLQDEIVANIKLKSLV